MLGWLRSRRKRRELELARARAREAAEAAATPDELEALADGHLASGDPIEAERLLRRALDRRERELGSAHPAFVHGLLALGGAIILRGGRYAEAYAEAEPVYRRALALCESAAGARSERLLECLEDLGSCLLSMTRADEAEQLFRRALDLREATLGRQHPAVARSLMDLVRAYGVQSRYRETEPLLERALAIRERALGAQHPEVAATLVALADLYAFEKRNAEAEPLYRRAREIGASPIRTSGT